MVIGSITHNYIKNKKEAVGMRPFLIIHNIDLFGLHL